MNWISQNINHLTVPLSMVLSAAIITMGLRDRIRKRQIAAGKTPLNNNPNLKLWIPILVVSGVLLGIALNVNFGHH
jgi:hypothetical protein